MTKLKRRPSPYTGLAGMCWKFGWDGKPFPLPTSRPDLREYWEDGKRCKQLALTDIEDYAILESQQQTARSKPDSIEDFERKLQEQYPPES